MRRLSEQLSFHFFYVTHVRALTDNSVSQHKLDSMIKFIQPTKMLSIICTQIL